MAPRDFNAKPADQRPSWGIRPNLFSASLTGEAIGTGYMPAVLNFSPTLLTPTGVGYGVLQAVT